MKILRHITEQMIVTFCFLILLGVWLYVLFGSAQRVELTDDAEKCYQGALDIGYIEVNEQGRAYISPEGEAYIERQKRLAYR